MKVLIMTCGTGGGHNTAAQALQDELEKRGHFIQTINPFDLKSKKLSYCIDHGYLWMARKTPRLNGAIYKLGECFQYFPSRSPVYHLCRLLTAEMADYLKKNPCDLIISTHVFPMEIMMAMKDKGLSIPPTIWVNTDYTCPPLTKEITADAAVIPATDLSHDFLVRNKFPHELYPLGIPVRHAFLQPIDRIQAREALGLEQDVRYLLIAGGSIGTKGVRSVVQILHRYYAEDPHTHLISICGGNQKLYDSLQAEYGNQITLLSYTNQIALYMKACDVLITKPGGLSSTEAAVVGIPMIHLTPIPGCETKNMQFFSKNGMSIAVRSPKKELLKALDHLEDMKNCENMKSRQRQVINASASCDICDLAEEIVQAREEMD